MSVPAALVTGASAGIGLAIATVLRDEGYRLTLSARDAARLEAAATGLGGEALTVPGDASDPEAVAGLIDAHVSRHGRLDVLVANAGWGRAAPLGRVRPEDLTKSLTRNVASPFLLVNDALAHLRGAAAQSGRALVILTASIVAQRPALDLAVYSATKAALVSLARSINLEAGGDGLRACALCPAYVDTAFSAWVHETVPPSAMLRPQDVAEAVRFLLRLSPNAVVEEVVIGRASAPGQAP